VRLSSAFFFPCRFASGGIFPLSPSPFPIQNFFFVLSVPFKPTFIFYRLFHYFSPPLFVHRCSFTRSYLFVFAFVWCPIRSSRICSRSCGRNVWRQVIFSPDVFRSPLVPFLCPNPFRMASPTQPLLSSSPSFHRLPSQHMFYFPVGSFVLFCSIPIRAYGHLPFLSNLQFSAH